jgi:hypothetical protein
MGGLDGWWVGWLVNESIGFWFGGSVTWWNGGPVVRMAGGSLVGPLIGRSVGLLLLAWRDGGLSDWWVRFYVDWLFGQSVRRLVSRSVDKWVDWLVSRSLGRWPGVLLACLVDWLFWLVGRSLGRRIVWTAVRLVYSWMMGRVLHWVGLSVRQSGSRLICRWVGWLVGWLVDLLGLGGWLVGGWVRR